MAVIMRLAFRDFGRTFREMIARHSQRRTSTLCNSFPLEKFAVGMGRGKRASPQGGAKAALGVISEKDARRLLGSGSGDTASRW
jgi:hypothetical protein